MRIFSALSLLLLPAAAFAGHAGGHGGGACCGGGHHPMAGLVVMAGAMWLGFWFLRNSNKEAQWTKTAGQVAGWVLMVVGLLGFICTTICTVKKAACKGKAGGGCPYSASQGGGGGSGGTGPMAGHDD